MTPAEAVGNIAAFAVQLAAIVAAARVLEAVLPVDRPRARLAYWQAVLALGLVLPFVQPWHVLPTPAAGLSAPAPTAPVSTVSPSVVAGVETEASLPASTPAALPERPVPIESIVLGLLITGCAVAAFRLGLAARALRRARLRSRPFDDDAAGSHADTRVSDDVASPVTYGVRRPVILLPPAFLRLAADERAAVLCHEQVHIERHHWLVQTFEEMLRVVLWFHPAFHWLLGRLRLAREQAVDAEVVQRLRCRTSYLEALVRLAASGRASSLVPVPTFFTRSHLAERVDLLLKEEPMSRARVLLSLASSAAAVALCAMGTIALVPFHASADQVTPPAPPVPPAAMVVEPAVPPVPPMPAVPVADVPDVPPAPAAKPLLVAKPAAPAPPAPPKSRHSDDVSDDEIDAIREERRQLAEERQALEKARRQLEEQSARMAEQAAKIAVEVQARMHEQTAKIQEQAQRIAEEQVRRVHEQTAQIREQALKEQGGVRREDDEAARSAREEGLRRKIDELVKRSRMWEERYKEREAADKKKEAEKQNEADKKND